MKKIMNYSLLMVLFSFITFSCSKTDMDELNVTSTNDLKLLGKITTPVITCYATYTTDESIGITVTAPSGGTGLPAGFSLQWMSVTDFLANGNQWYASDDSRLCKGSFSGNASDSRYRLLEGQSIHIKIGEILLDNGASSNCTGALDCNVKDYVFRAFGHATNTLNRSDFTNNLSCSTLACNTDGGCTFTQGYWKNHGPGLCTSGNNNNVWGTTSMSLGLVSYSDSELCTILNAPVKGNGYIALAHQLIAAKLNVINGANSIDAIGIADVLIGNKNVLTNSINPALTSLLVNQLSTYNEGGAEGENHCD